MLERFFSPEEDEAHQLQRVRAALDVALEQAELAGYQGDLGLAVLRAQLQSQLQSGTGGGFLGGGVAFCSLAPMRSLPFAVVCLLGMDDTAFPREQRPPGFDLMARRFRFGDRSRRGDDRYLFLETLISARRCLYLSYVGQDQRDNAPLPPSVLVSELLDYLDQLSAGAARKQLVAHHPLQPFSRRYFEPDSGLFSYSPAMAAAARRLGEAAAPPAPLLPQDLPDPDPEWRQIELQQLLYFYANPTRFLLQQRLGIRLEPGEGLLETRDPFGLDFFPRQELARGLVEQALEGRGGGALEARWRAAGRLPQGNIGARLFAREADHAAVFVANLVQIYESAPERSLAVDLSLGGLRLVGVLTGVRPDGLFGYSVHKIWDGQLIELWLRHLVLNALAPPGVEPVSRWLDPKRLYRFPPMADAGERLAELLAAYWQGLCRPLPLFPKSSLTYVRKLAAGKDPESALKAAEQVWGGDFTPNPERDSPYYRLAFPDGVVFGQEFDRLSRQLLLPLAEAEMAAEPD
jgi:exodeoxyribonuclease V gamma subunit